MLYPIPVLWRIYLMQIGHCWVLWKDLISTASTGDSPHPRKLCSFKDDLPLQTRHVVFSNCQYSDVLWPNRANLERSRLKQDPLDHWNYFSSESAVLGLKVRGTLGEVVCFREVVFRSETAGWKILCPIETKHIQFISLHRYKFIR